MGKRILLVEDEPEVLRLMAARIKSLADDITVEFASDGDEALQKIFSAPPDLIFLDIMLPRVSGQEVLRLTRKNPKTADIPIIVITALPASHTKYLLVKLGATEFLEKPVDSALLNSLVCSHLGM